MRLLCFILVFLAGPASAQQGAARNDLMHEFEFAETRIADFELHAQTQVNWDGEHPFVDRIECFGDNQDIRFTVDRLGQLTSLWLAFQGLPDEDGDRPHITLLGDRIWLFVDGRRYEFANIPTRDDEDRFRNYDYPPVEHPDIILPVWRGHRGVRRSDAAPFMHMSRIYGELVGAEKLEWGFKSRNWEHVDQSEPENQLPEGWQRRRYPIDNRGLKDAVDWCTRQVASDAGTRLPR